MVEEIPIKIGALGITVEASKVYCQGSIFILKL